MLRKRIEHRPRELRGGFELGGIPFLRPCPADFVERYIAGGWAEIEGEYGARAAVIKRWIAECGGEALKSARQAFTRDHGRVMTVYLSEWEMAERLSKARGYGRFISPDSPGSNIQVR